MPASRWASWPSAPTMRPTHPADSPAGLKQQAKDNGFVFPYLYDESQDVAHAYKAACTPDIYLFDGRFPPGYRGQYDESRPGNGVPVTGKDLRAAIDRCLRASRFLRIRSRRSAATSSGRGKSSGVGGVSRFASKLFVPALGLVRRLPAPAPDWQAIREFQAELRRAVWPSTGT